GGGSGIGKAISTVFAKQGAEVYILDMDEAGGNSTTDEIIKAGNKAIFNRCDVSNQAEIKKIISSIAEKNGHIAILVNNAGIAHVGNAETTNEEDFDRLIKVN
ncbi:SDR family NAD(P)-dependent oxidoreductase, partial [Rhizobium leguminosarum]|uniref:SDR family NAD(P)-dependent oxidoreductase n=1 Tax=Rhizobium leguminosarum TaxID=384 RepID=UPI003F99ABD8